MATPVWIEPMLPASAEPMDIEGWIYEAKFDGFRCLASKIDGEVKLLSRNGKVDFTDKFPEIVEPLKRNSFDFLIDSELTVAGDDGNPDLHAAQLRVGGNEGKDAVLYVFDMMFAGGIDIRSKPLIERKDLLSKLLKFDDAVKFSDHYEGDGEAIYRSCLDIGLEGSIAKDPKAPYEGKRTQAMLKFKEKDTRDYAVVGWTPGKSDPDTLGALVLGLHNGENFEYAGKVGAGKGFTLAVRKQFHELMNLLPAGPVLDKVDNARWVTPSFSIEVEVQRFTGTGKPRHPKLVRIRDDKSPAECVI